MQIVPILGQVKYKITLDPSSWIFDDRKIALDDYYDDSFDLDDFLEDQNDERAGAAIPRLAKAYRKYKREDWLKESFVMPLKLFINNSEPLDGAKEIQFEKTNGDTIHIPLDKVNNSALQFSQDGKLLAETGPLIFLSSDRSQPPVTHISKITIF